MGRSSPRSSRSRSSRHRYRDLDDDYSPERRRRHKDSRKKSKRKSSHKTSSRYNKTSEDDTTRSRHHRIRDQIMSETTVIKIDSESIASSQTNQNNSSAASDSSVSYSESSFVSSDSSYYQKNSDPEDDYQPSSKKDHQQQKKEKSKKMSIFVLIVQIICTAGACQFFHHHLEYQSRVVHSLYHLHLALQNSHQEHLNYKNAHLHLSSEIVRLKLRLEHQYHFMHELTTFSRQNYIRIKGIAEEEAGVEEKQNMVEEKVFDLANYVGVPKLYPEFNIKNIERASRVGKPIKSKQNKYESRMIVAEVSSVKIKNFFIQAASRELRNTGYFVYDYLATMGMAGVDKPIESIINKDEHDEHQALHAERNCGYIKEIREPNVVAKGGKTFGAWMQDPAKNLDERVWLIENFHQSYFIEEYATIHDLKNRRMRRKIRLPIYFGGTGHVIYKEHLYFNKFNTSLIVKFDLNNLKIVKEVEMTQAVYGNHASYSWQGHTDYDFSIDEEGLWLIYATHENALDIVISKINPESLQIEEESHATDKHYAHSAAKHTKYATYKTNWKKLWSANAFTACGVLYTLQKFDVQKTNLNYVYDMHKRAYKHVKIPFKSKYKWISSVNYNHKTRQLYVWDKSYLMTYDVVFHNSSDSAYFGNELMSVDAETGAGTDQLNERSDL